VSSSDAAAARPGYLIPIGGAERKQGSARVLRRFVDLCGAAGARIAILPTASKLESTGPRYERVFREFGAGEAYSLPFRTRQDCRREDWLERLSQATGIFMTGGSQLRLSRTLGGTPVTRVIRETHAAGAHVAGTSAGASYMSEHMIAFGEQGATPRTHMVALAPGIGLTRDFTIDQHFRERDRLGRLLTALAYNPDVVGLGLDENTAAFISPDRTVEILGSGSCTIVDGADLDHSSVGKQADDPVCLIGVRMHILLDGSVYDIDTRRATAPPEGPDREVQET
jgi:cyanophycinase